MIKQLIIDIAYDNIKLSQAITRTKLVESKIKNDTLKIWLNKELGGYNFNDNYLPPYRKVWSVINLTLEYPFGRTRTYPVVFNESFGADILDMINNHRIIEPISIVEQQIENLGDKVKGYIHIPPQQVQMLESFFKEEIDIYGGVVISGKREVGKIQYQNVLEQTKQKLIETLMELENEFPNLIDDYQMTDENNHKVQNIITNNIYGDNNPMNIAAGQSVEQSGNTITINANDIEKLRELGVNKEQIEELKIIVSENTKDKSKLTSKVMKWLGNVAVSIAEKGFYNNLPVLTEYVNQLIS